MNREKGRYLSALRIQELGVSCYTGCGCASVAQVSNISQHINDSSNNVLLNFRNTKFVERTQ